MKKVLFIIPSLSQANGISSFLINYISNMNLKKFDVDILCSNLRPSKEYLNILKNKNVKCYFIGYIKDIGLCKYVKSIKEFFKKNNNYDLVYSNLSYQSFIFFKYAKRMGIKKFAIHSHSYKMSSSKMKNIIANILQKHINKEAKYKFACSKLAGDALFKKYKYRIINNAINYEKYKYSLLFKEEKRKELNISSEKKVIGFVGRFVPVKNILFFKKLAEKISDDYVIVMIGTGPLKAKFIDDIKEAKLSDKFIFLDEISNVNEYYSLFDYFLLPSHYEGLPVVGIEAQANGVPCIFSDTITKESKISDNTYFVDRNDVEKWVKLIKKLSRDKSTILNNSFNIFIQAKKFENIISDIVNN